ncbi:MAG TPA: hypothetical protein VGO43_11810 [Pyrinomonadaceae bacterium]|jgi:hypothetical protein|nr:hypothetical protein [Pyrinomonadaceae bacterium]
MNYSAIDDTRDLERQRSERSADSSLRSDAAKVMYDALVQIARSDAFFDREKRLVRIAREAIEKATRVSQEKQL